MGYMHPPKDMLLYKHKTLILHIVESSRGGGLTHTNMSKRIDVTPYYQRT
jgi:hypothetical protein